MYNINTFCNILTALRKGKAWTQMYLAEKLGVSPQAVSKWETGIGFPDVTLFPEIAQIFDVPIGVLFGEKHGLSKKNAYMTELKMQFPLHKNWEIFLGNTCRVEFIDDLSDECRIIVKGDPVFLEFFSVEAENDTLIIRIKNPSGSDTQWIPYDRGRYTDHNLVQIFSGIPSDKLNICAINYLDLCCYDHITPDGNLEYICIKDTSPH